MKNLVNILKATLDLAIRKYDVHPTNITAEETDLSEVLLDYIEQFIFNKDEEETLDFEENRCENGNELEGTNVNYSSESDLDNDSQKEKRLDCSLKKMKEIIHFYDSCKENKFKKTKYRYPQVKQTCYIARFRKYISENGNKKEKLKIIKKNMISKFKISRHQNLPIHDVDLKRWASIKAKELNWERFKASDPFILSFKRKFGIVSRKITKYTTVLDTRNKESIENSAIEFVLETQDTIESMNPDQIFNADQSGLNYFLASDRTLSHIGEKHTKALIGSKFSASHSYTIMPTISMSGELKGKLFICLREPGGKFGPLVSKNIFRPPNVYVTCSKSGKMCKNKMKEWVIHCLNPILEPPSCIILDSWTGFRDPDIYKHLPENCTQLRIPPNTTALIQPLDVYFFRQYKLFVKHIINRIAIDSLNIDVKSRNEIIKIHSLVYNQLQSPEYKPMIQYAWFKCNISNFNPGKFANVQELSLKLDSEECGILGCPSYSFLKCTHCHIFLCFSHFYEQFHYH